MDLTLVPYHHHHQQQQHSAKSQQTHIHHNNGHTPTKTTHDFLVRYKECMRNHAASIGGHANDGCGEFIAAADDASLTCAACGCHRNFHRREGTHSHQHYEHLFLSPPPPPQPPQLIQFYNAGGGGGSSSSGKKHLASHRDLFDDDDKDDDQDRRSETPERGEVNFRSAAEAAAVKNKRFRTKFTQEQKDRMLEFAEKIGWRINKQDEDAINQFCSEIGVKRNVLKVWMHNNKTALRRTREEAPLLSTVAPSTVPPQPVGV